MSLYDPGFKYYAPRPRLAEIQDGRLAVTGQMPRERAMHADVLQAACKLFLDPGMKQSWTSAMTWSWFNWMPDYFFTAPASATRKYHPAWANRPDGLLLHSLAVCRVAASLSELLDMTSEAHDALVFAAWHHDMFKYGGKDGYADGDMTVHEHPVLAGDYFRLEHVISEMAMFGIGPGPCGMIADLISTHAGPYRSSRFSDLKLPECADPMNKLLYKADYIASRKEDDWVKDMLAQIP